MEHFRAHAYTSVMPIRWGDMDALGHVNNTVYFRYMEQLRVEWLESLGYVLSPAREDGIVVINASCTFLAPLTYPGEVEVQMWLGKPGRSSLQSHYEMRKVGEETLYAEGAAKMVWMNPATGKSVPIPDYILQSIDS